MANLANIKDEVLRIVEAHLTALTSSITTHVQRAQRSIEDRCAFAAQHTTVTYTTTVLNSFFVWPSDFVAVRDKPVYLKALDDLRWSFIDESRAVHELGVISADNTGPPTHWSEETNSGLIGIQTFPRTDGNGPSLSSAGGYDITVLYFGRLSTLTVDADTNWWSENIDDVLAWKAAANVFAELRDPMAQFWNSVAVARFIEVLNAMKRNKVRGRLNIYPSDGLSASTNHHHGRYHHSRRHIITRVP